MTGGGGPSSATRSISLGSRPAESLGVLERSKPFPRQDAFWLRPWRGLRQHGRMLHPCQGKQSKRSSAASSLSKLTSICIHGGERPKPVWREHSRAHQHICRHTELCRDCCALTRLRAHGSGSHHAAESMAQAQPLAAALADPRAMLACECSQGGESCNLFHRVSE